MSRSGRGRQPRVRESKSQRERQLRPQELEKEIWTRRDAKIPGNPRYTDHEPMMSIIIDSHGDRVPIIKSRTVAFDAGAAGINKSEIHSEILFVPSLWENEPWHRVLTHALRYLQACCITDQNPRYQNGDMRLMRGGISPLDLLKQSGLEAGAASEVMKTFKQLELVEFRNTSKTQCWFVHLVYRALGPQLQKYTRAELIDGWCFPEEPNPADEGADDVSENDTEAGPSDDEGDADLDVTDAASAVSVIELLEKVYAACLSFVPKEPEFKEGYAMFSSPGPLTDLIPEMTDVTKSQTRQTLMRLGHLEVTRFRMIGQGRWERLIKLDHGPFTAQDVERLREIAKQKQEDRQLVKDPNNRLAFLRDAYKAIKATVPKGIVPDKAGYVTYDTNFSMVTYLAEEIEGLTVPQAERLLEDFRVIGVLENKNKGSKVERRLKINKRFSSKDVDKIRAARRKPGSGESKPIVLPQHGAPADEIEEVMVALADRLDAYAAQITDLETQLADKDNQIADKERQIKELQGKLASQPSAPSQVLERLRHHLK